MQFAGAKKPPVGIVYDSDFGSSIDTVLALALLHGLEGKNEARVAGLTISSSDLRSAQLCDVVEKFYASATTGVAAMFQQALTVGLADADGTEGGHEICTAVLAQKDVASKVVYSPRIRKLNDTAVPEILMRNALSAQYDGNAAIVSCGPPVNLMRLLALPGAKELIRAKVRMLVVAGTVDGRLAANWPTPVAVASEDLGRSLPYPAASIEKDFSYATAHPVADAYRACHSMPYDAPATAMAAALYAARPDKGYFTVAKGILAADAAQKELIISAYTQLASAKPQPRIRRPLVVEENKVDENKVAQ